MNINSIIFQHAAIGDYVFLIMIVLASIVQAIMQNKKKKNMEEIAGRKTDNTGTQSADMMERKPERMSGYDKPAENILESIQKMLAPELEFEDHDWGEDYAIDNEEKEVVRNSDNTEEQLVQKIEERHAVLFPAEPVIKTPAITYRSKIREGFSLRKAVVYSEILNRKYT